MIGDQLQLKFINFDQPDSNPLAIQLRGENITADNIQIKRNKFLGGFVRNLKVRVSNKQLWLMKVCRYLSLLNIYFFNPFFVICQEHEVTNVCLVNFFIIFQHI